jgi:hypothetical protein
MENPSLDFLTTVVKITAQGAILVLDLSTGVGGTQTGVPPLTVAGIPGVPGSQNVFTSSMILPKPGKEIVPIVDPVSSGMLSNLLTWTTQKKLTAKTGFEYLFCNLGAMRGLQKGSGPVTFRFTTPPGNTPPPVNQTYYWVTPLFYTPPPNSQPVIPALWQGGGVNVAIWTDTTGQAGSANIVVTSTNGNHTAGLIPTTPVGRPYISTPPFTWPNQPQYNSAFQYLASFNSEFANSYKLTVITIPVSQPDTTAWSIRGGVWQKQKAFADLTPAGGLPNWPVLPPAAQPTSQGAAAGTTPSRTVTITVTAPPDNTLTIS